MSIDRPKEGEKAILVHVVWQTTPADGLQEFKELAEAAGAEVLACVTVTIREPNAKYLLGTGKLEEIAELARGLGAELVIVNSELTPGQERSLELYWKVRVINRVGLILDIFAQRARTFEGKLQVELAQLSHLSTRLIRGWTHLERQKGGIGLRGPGETQLETDRRLLRNRIVSIQNRLNKVRQQRQQGRKSRNKAALPTVAVVGYTNAGKSTLFNGLTGHKVFAADQLFATLDPTLRSLEIPVINKVVLADTVGFIRDLPHQLVAAFKATLEETKEADLLLHVVDYSDDLKEEKINAVNAVLEEVGASKVPQILVYNKIDLVEAVEPHVQENERGTVYKVWLSALKAEGLNFLKDAIANNFCQFPISGKLTLPQIQAEIRSTLYAASAIECEEYDAQGSSVLTIKTVKILWDKLCKQYIGLEKQFVKFEQSGN